MRKFQQNVNRELRRATPDRLRQADDDDNGDGRVDFSDYSVDEEEEELEEEEGHYSQMVFDVFLKL